MASKADMRSSAFLAGMVCCALAARASANPTGMQVVAGQVSAVTAGNSLQITNSPGAIINWRSFSIMPGELTRFIQQSSSSSVLNRITGQGPSQILGALQSNGKVFLINPNGMVFGAGARVNVNGLVASSLDMSNADFLAGKLKFSGAATAGSVTNYGGITTPGGGQVYLIAPSVTNSGLITSPSGDVVLAAGHSVDLADSGNPDLRVVISAPGDQALNVGKIIADSGKVGVYGALVNQLGLVSANTAVAGENGKIVFKASDTTLLGAGSATTARGSDAQQGAGSGGEIQVLGNRVGITGDATVDASGQSGGGTVLIGGDTHGANPSIQNAALAYVGPQAQINASAAESGQGGKVVVWSDQQTWMYGSISARGGAAGGDGGFVETSSERKLDFQGRVDLRAPAGTAGTLLLDPSDVLISSGPSSGDVSLPSGAPFTITGSNDSSVLSAADLENELALGNVTVTTSSSANAPLGGTITVAAPVTWSNSNNLTLTADQSIYINAPITATSATLVLNSVNGSITQALSSSAPATLSVGSLAANAANGSVSLTEPTNAITGAVAGVAGQGFSLVNTGTLTVGTVGSATGITGTSSSAPFNGVFLQTSSAGDITLNGPVNAGASTAVISATGAVNQGPGGLITANSARIYANGGDIGSSGTPLLLNVGQLLNAEAQSGSVSINNSGNNSGALLVNYVLAGGAVNIVTTGTLTTNTPQACDCVVSVTGSAVNLSAGGLIDIVAGSNISGTNGVSLYAGYDPASSTYASSNNTLGIEGSVSGSSVALSAGGAINIAGTVTGTLTQTPNQYAATSIPPPPTLSQCIANPALAGCSTVLPTLAQCEATPSTPGCSVILPTITQCTATPTLAGCSTVLPTLAQCESTPSTAGCSAVLPTLAQCESTPSTAGCGAVLPTIAQCTATPGLAGCSTVLPTLAQCESAPSTAGCGAVLPTIAQCTATPGLTGCSAVLPTLTQCESAPSTAGCSAVLPTAAQCAAIPSLAGCNDTQSASSGVSANIVATTTSAVNLIPATTGLLLQTSNDATNAQNSTAASSGDSISDKGNTKSQPDPTGSSGAKNENPSKKLYCN